MEAGDKVAAGGCDGNGAQLVGASGDVDSEAEGGVRVRETRESVEAERRVWCRASASGAAKMLLLCPAPRRRQPDRGVDSGEREALVPLVMSVAAGTSNHQDWYG